MLFSYISINHLSMPVKSDVSDIRLGTDLHWITSNTTLLLFTVCSSMCNKSPQHNISNSRSVSHIYINLLFIKHIFGLLCACVWIHVAVMSFCAIYLPNQAAITPSAFLQGFDCLPCSSPWSRRMIQTSTSASSLTRFATANHVYG